MQGLHLSVFSSFFVGGGGGGGLSASNDSHSPEKYLTTLAVPQSIVLGFAGEKLIRRQLKDLS